MNPLPYAAPSTETDGWSRWVVAAGLSLAVILASACGAASDLPGSSGGDALPPWDLEVEHRIGSIDDPDYALTTLGEVVIGPEGRLFVAQPREGTIRVFDAGGGASHLIGRQGEGPGEFGTLSSISLWGDTLYAADARRGWVTFFSPEGDLLREARWTPLQMGTVSGEGRSWFSFISLFLATDSTALIEPGGMVRGSTFGPVSGVEVLESNGAEPTFGIGPDGETVDTLDWRQWSSVRLRMPVGGGDATIVSCPWTERSLASIRPVDPAVVRVDRSTRFPDGQSPTFAVTVIGATGDTLARRDIPFQPVPLTEEDVRAEFTEYRESRMGDDGSYPSVGAMIDGFEGTACIPPIHTPVSHLTPAQDGTIWLRREAVRADSTPWDVLDAMGTPMGRVVLPAGQTVLTARGDVMVASELDEYDVPYLVRYRVVR